MIWLGPLAAVDPETGLDADDPLAALTVDDRAWLDHMGDVLPRSMPVTGSSWWLIVRTDPAIVGYPPRPTRPSPTVGVLR